jgi:hypothetical protein
MVMGFKHLAAGILTAAFAMASSANLAIAQPVPENNPQVQSLASDRQAVEYANHTYLAYVPSSSSLVNAQTETGLGVLGRTLAERTTVKPKGVVALDLENDELSYFPFIYWPVTDQARTLSAKARENVQDYINKGGVILFDTMDHDARSANGLALRKVLEGIDIRPLGEVEKGHTLTQTFYLLNTLPGSYKDAKIWAEIPAGSSNENVSSVIIGTNNWAGAWSGTTIPAGSKEGDMALRAGINLVIYALTGNYKDDAAHRPDINNRRGPE